MLPVIMSQIPGFFAKLINAQRKILLKDATKISFLRNLFTSSFVSKQVAFKLSDIGEGIREVVIKEWFVNVGDKVSQFDNICEVQSDKASVTITSRYDGIISKLHYQVDDVALVGQPLVNLEVENDDAVNEEVSSESSDKTEEVENPEEIKTEIPLSSDNTVLCIPSVRRLIKEYKIDVSKVKGTGKQGRVLKEDVLKHIEKKEIPSKLQDFHVEPIKGFTKAMFKTMTEALKIPHFVYSDEIDVTSLSALRTELKKVPQLDINITFLPFLIKATSNSLKRYPIINSSIDQKEENIIFWNQHNIGIAMATNQGLAVPVIKHVENLSIFEIAKELNRLIKSGKSGNFSPNDLSGATFSVSNIGIIGGTYTKPVISPPQVAILAIGKTQVLPRFDDSGNLVRREIMNISGSADHRIIDGVSMANFIKTLKNQLENPNLLFLDL
ncbi:hypothetical protein ABEB36_011380 [Hypothenemus hampei]|uniref:Dihydrolipoamide acetyltransferase component of pyruvate dehydrogenase complex n=2 Tax=Hypothenemus hampei TaxID=57062 RepID=A0ABD1EFR7_HYPHA